MRLSEFLSIARTIWSNHLVKRSYDRNRRESESDRQNVSLLTSCGSHSMSSGLKGCRDMRANRRSENEDYGEPTAECLGKNPIEGFRTTCQSKQIHLKFINSLTKENIPGYECDQHWLDVAVGGGGLVLIEWRIVFGKRLIFGYIRIQISQMF